MRVKLEKKEIVYILHHTKGKTNCKQHLLLRNYLWVKVYNFLGISTNKLLRMFEWTFQLCSFSSSLLLPSLIPSFFSFNPPSFLFPSSLSFFSLILHKYLYCLLLHFSCLCLPSPLKKMKTANIISTGKWGVVLKRMKRGVNGYEKNTLYKILNELIKSCFKKEQLLPLRYNHSFLFKKTEKQTILAFSESDS